jgi:hypothetical protein
MDWGLTQPLTKTSIKSLPGGKRLREPKAENFVFYIAHMGHTAIKSYPFSVTFVVEHITDKSYVLLFRYA